MSRRIKRTTAPGARPKSARQPRDFPKSGCPLAHRPGRKPAPFPRAEKPRESSDAPANAGAEPPMPTRDILDSTGAPRHSEF